MVPSSLKPRGAVPAMGRISMRRPVTLTDVSGEARRAGGRVLGDRPGAAQQIGGSLSRRIAPVKGQLLELIALLDAAGFEPPQVVALAAGSAVDPLGDVDAIRAARQREADVFYADLAPEAASADERLVQRRALAGLLWSKQSYLFDVAKWLDGDDPALPPRRRRARNLHWRHLNSMRVMSMPDKWEYPWFAAWDLAFQCVPFALVDPRFAKDQLWVLLFEQFQHPSVPNPKASQQCCPLVHAGLQDVVTHPPLMHVWFAPHPCWRVHLPPQLSAAPQFLPAHPSK